MTERRVDTPACLLSIHGSLVFVSTSAARRSPDQPLFPGRQTHTSAQRWLLMGTHQMRDVADPALGFLALAIIGMAGRATAALGALVVGLSLCCAGPVDTTYLAGTDTVGSRALVDRMPLSHAPLVSAVTAISIATVALSFSCSSKSSLHRAGVISQVKPASGRRSSRGLG